MKLGFITRGRVVITIWVIGLIVVVIMLTPGLWRHAPSREQAPAKVAADTQSKSDKTAMGPSANSAASPQPATLESSSPACRQFTLDTAKVILGSDTTIDMQDSAVISDTSDLLTSSCTYQANNSNSVQLHAYIAKTSVGESTNAVMFGSGKPPGVQDIPGYGQAAYWDVHTGTLSVLKNNNRYDLSRSSGALEDVLHAADSIMSKL